jgi:hypothetical protein
MNGLFRTQHSAEIIVHYEVVNQELKRRPIHEFRCDEVPPLSRHSTTTTLYPTVYSVVANIEFIL